MNRVPLLLTQLVMVVVEVYPNHRPNLKQENYMKQEKHMKQESRERLRITCNIENDSMQIYYYIYSTVTTQQI